MYFSFHEVFNSQLQHRGIQQRFLYNYELSDKKRAFTLCEPSPDEDDKE